jgi:hypothetical protein
MVQEPFAAMEPLLRLRVPLAALTLPPHVFVKAGVAATTSPDGNASANETLVNA